MADASGGAIIFVKRSLSFSQLSTFSLSSLDPYSDYAEVNISLNNFSSLSFLKVYAPPIRSSTKDSRTIFFSLSILPSYVEAEAVDFSRFRRKRTASTASASSFPFRFRIPGFKTPFFLKFDGLTVFLIYFSCKTNTQKFSGKNINFCPCFDDVYYF